MYIPEYKVNFIMARRDQSVSFVHNGRPEIFIYEDSTNRCKYCGSKIVGKRHLCLECGSISCSKKSFFKSSSHTLSCQICGKTICPDCASWLFTRPDGMDELVNVRATLLADAAGFSPFMETWTADKLPWATTPAIHSFPGFPPMEAYPALLAEFAGSTAAPGS